MTELVARGRYRINSIDILRGIVMVIMALDHTRDFFHKVDLSQAADAAMDPTNINTTFPLLFFTRWITHFCAPIFVFLSGASAWLMSQKKTKKELSTFLLTRGIWLVIVEIVIITFGWTFNPHFNVFILQVIWAIGISMIIMGLIVWLPWKLILTLGLIIVFGHNLLDYPNISNDLKGSTTADLLYFSQFSPVIIDKTHVAIVVYAFLPWTGVMMLGYCFGKLFASSVDPVKRKKILWQMGLGLILLFIIFRFINGYGDPVKWGSSPRGSLYTFFSFINVNKYPPSLDFLCIMIGVGMIMLSLLETARNKLTEFFRVYGRVPMLYYILHFYLLHLILIVVFYAQGFGSKDIVPQGLPFYFKPNGIGFGLAGVYAVWIFVVAVLYFICKKYDRYKTANVEKKWWLSYL